MNFLYLISLVSHLPSQKNKMTRTLITTADGSHSIAVKELDENYHSVHGAIQESEHVFIDAGLKALSTELNDIYIFEMGFGTGLNAFLTYLYTKNTGVRVHYTAIEAYPITTDFALQLNYLNQLNAREHQAVFNALHQCEWSEKQQITPNFHLTKVQDSLEECSLPNEQFHLVYYDAFAPSAQPELWEEAIFSKIYASMQNKGILTTYCAKGSVKRTLKKVGFTIEKLPGPIGKREMTRAWK